MKISESNVLLASSHFASETHSVKESIRAWSGGPPSSNPSSVVSLSDQAKVQSQNDDSDEAQLDPRLKLLVHIVEVFLGKKIKLVSAADLKALQERAHDTPEPQATPASQGQGWGLAYDRVETHSESEQTNFAAQGVIKTADGKEINFNLQLSMARSFQSQDSVSVRAGDAAVKTKDPLVINFDGTAAELTSSKFDFDLDSDGTKDQMSFVSPGSGFLALDLNNNGKIDDGSELFGTKSGDGFADLAKYDADGNHWIDENDDVFSKLRVWSKDAQGQDNLATLAQRNVGALYLGNVETPFSAKNTDNQLQGQVRASGIYLQENGAVGTLQQVDLAV